MTEVKVVKPVKEPLSPTALDVETAARMLSISPETIHKHTEAGLPANADGTINLVHYAAWLNQQLRKANS